MLTKPNLDDSQIIKNLEAAYNVSAKEICFLPLGADLNTAVYCVKAKGGKNYFLKLRRGDFNEAGVLVPKFLADLGVKQIISPYATTTGKLWVNLGQFKMILYPYMEGRNGVDAGLSAPQWGEFGAALKRLHSAHIPKTVMQNVQQETFSFHWGDVVKAFLLRIENDSFEKAVAAKMALFLKSKRDEIFKLVCRTENLADFLKQQHFDYVLCHADIHGWNLFIDQQNTLYIVDWDTLIFAPKERDLMFIGSGLEGGRYMSFEQEALFYKGYGQTDVNQEVIAYYRYARIIEDIGVYCEQIFLSDEGGEDRMQSFKYLQSHFLPNGTIDRAYASDRGILF
jgi:spectinomycin phosphotransferase